MCVCGGGGGMGEIDVHDITMGIEELWFSTPTRIFSMCLSKQSILSGFDSCYPAVGCAEDDRADDV